MYMCMWLQPHHTWLQYRGLGQRLAAEGFVAVIVGYETWPLADAAAQARAARELALALTLPLMLTQHSL